MATKTARESPAGYTVVEPIDEDGACTLCERSTGTSYHVVDYADPVIREKLSARSVGEAVRLELTPADPDGVDWIVTRIKPGTPATPGHPW